MFRLYQGVGVFKSNIFGGFYHGTREDAGSPKAKGSVGGVTNFFLFVLSPNWGVN